jgi:ketosteroid isomerase-like protein
MDTRIPIITALAVALVACTPYHAIVRSRVRAAFDALNRRDPGPALEIMADDVRYTFAGDHALGGTRVTKDAVARWMQRLFRLFHNRFRIVAIDVVGAPWSTTVFTRFEDSVEPAVGAPYVNGGVQVIELRWGKAVRIHTHVDTALLVRALDHMAHEGVEEAAAPPILR